MNRLPTATPGAPKDFSNISWSAATDVKEVRDTSGPKSNRSEL